MARRGHKVETMRATNRDRLVRDAWWWDYKSLQYIAAKGKFISKRCSHFHITYIICYLSSDCSDSEASKRDTHSTLKTT